MVPSGSTALSSSAGTNVVTKKMGIIETIKQILHNGGLKELWRGLGPALVLVINPIIQYTVFEQLKNLLITRRTARLSCGGIQGCAKAWLKAGRRTVRGVSRECLL